MQDIAGFSRPFESAGGPCRCTLPLPHSKPISLHLRSSSHASVASVVCAQSECHLTLPHSLVPGACSGGGARGDPPGHHDSLPRMCSGIALLLCQHALAVACTNLSPIPPVSHTPSQVWRRYRPVYILGVASTAARCAQARDRVTVRARLHTPMMRSHNVESLCRKARRALGVLCGFRWVAGRSGVAVSVLVREYACWWSCMYRRMLHVNCCNCKLQLSTLSNAAVRPAPSCAPPPSRRVRQAARRGRPAARARVAAAGRRPHTP